jgi:hypothetical protein
MNLSNYRIVKTLKKPQMTNLRNLNYTFNVEGRIFEANYKLCLINKSTEGKEIEHGLIRFEGKEHDIELDFVISERSDYNVRVTSITIRQNADHRTENIFVRNNDRYIFEFKEKEVEREGKRTFRWGDMFVKGALNESYFDYENDALIFTIKGSRPKN